MKKSLFVLALAGVSLNCFATANFDHHVPEFVGGLKLDNIKQCNAALETACPAGTKNPFENTFDCRVPYMKKTPLCAQNLALQNVGSITSFIEVKPFHTVDVIHANVLRADGSDDYFMANKYGELLSLATWNDVNLKATPGFADVKKKFPKAELWAQTSGFPTLASLPEKGFRLVFTQPLLNGCRACEVAGSADVAYDFTQNGKFTGVKVLKVTVSS